jgi:hypothetical protein
MRVVICVFFVLINFAAHSQVPDKHLRFVDSIENATNSSLKKFIIKKDTGTIFSKDKKKTGSYEKQFYIDRKSNTLHLVNYLKMFVNGVIVNENYYYLNNKPISAYTLKQAKRKILPEDVYYFYKDQIHHFNDSTVLKSNSEIKINAEVFLKQYRQLK